MYGVNLCNSKCVVVNTKLKPIKNRELTVMEVLNLTLNSMI